MIFNSKQTIEGNIIVQDEKGNTINIAFCNATINENKTGYNMMIQIIDIEKYEQYIEEVKIQHQKFRDLIDEKLIELNYGL